MSTWLLRILAAELMTVVSTRKGCMDSLPGPVDVTRSVTPAIYEKTTPAELIA